MSGMSSVQHLRELISERLTAAAEEIFSVVQRTIVQYEEEMDRQRRLLDVTWRAQVHLDRTDLPHHFLSKEEAENPADQQLWNQEVPESSLGQEEPEPPRIKEEHEDLCFIQGEEQLVLKQDADGSTVTSSEAEPDLDRFRCENFPGSEGRDPLGSRNDDSGLSRDPELKPKKKRSRTGSPAGFWSSREGDQPVLKQEADESLEDRDPNGELLIPVSIPAAEVRHQQGSWNKESGTKENRIRRKNRRTCVAQGELGTRPVSCDVCGKAFRCNSDMRVHYRTHTGEKPFSCAVCQRAFSFKVNLSVHMRTHTGEKPYSCKFCEKRFSDHSSLKKHNYVHTGERPYSCAVCGKRFSRNSHRGRHLRLHVAAAPST